MADPDPLPPVSSPTSVPASHATVTSDAVDEDDRRAGIPGWIVLAAVVVALGVSILIVTQISSSLSGLVNPPDPVVAPHAVLQSQGTDNVGDYWVYTTPDTGCMTAAFYQKLYGNCTLSPASGCQPDGSTDPKNYAIPGPMTIVQCNATQTIGQYHISWQINVSVNNDQNLKSATTTFRISRDLG